MPDVPAIAAVAHADGVLVIDDNTWATPLFRRSLDEGVDISIQAATKYIERDAMGAGRPDPAAAYRARAR
jgi:cystathionine beta-lyase/cystathionine gamma-synthase